MTGIEAIRHYVKMRLSAPLRGLGETIHHIHPGTEFDAELRLSDLIKVIQEFDSLTGMSREQSK